MNHFKLVFVVLIFTFGQSCITPVPVDSTKKALCDQSPVNHTTAIPVGLGGANNILTGERPATAADYNQLITDGFTNILILTDEGTATRQDVLNLLALGFFPSDLHTIKMDASRPEHFCSAMKEGLQLIQAIRSLPQRKLRIYSHDANWPTIMVMQAHKLLVQRRPLHEVFENSCIASGQCSASLELVQTLYRMRRQLEADASIARLDCEALPELTAQDQKYVQTYASCSEPARKAHDPAKEIKLTQSKLRG